MRVVFSFEVLTHFKSKPFFIPPLSSLCSDSSLTSHRVDCWILAGGRHDCIYSYFKNTSPATDIWQCKRSGVNTPFNRPKEGNESFLQVHSCLHKKVYLSINFFLSHPCFPLCFKHPPWPPTNVDCWSLVGGCHDWFVFLFLRLLHPQRNDNVNDPE